MLDRPSHTNSKNVVLVKQFVGGYSKGYSSISAHCMNPFPALQSLNLCSNVNHTSLIPRPFHSFVLPLVVVNSVCNIEHTVVRNIVPARNGLIVMTLKLFVSRDTSKKWFDSEDLGSAEINIS